MHSSLSQLPYSGTGFFSKIILDYIDKADQLKQFYSFGPDIEGIKEALEKRRNVVTDRSLLVKVLENQYAQIESSGSVKKNIDLLALENTFTICTAHQPNIFTGHLYFIYKILHTVKIAEQLKTTLPGNNFVPVFYMGSEDADLEELGHIHVAGQKYEWKTTQTGAVGRMKVDKAFLNIIEEVSGQLTIFPFGEELMRLIIECYVKDYTIQDATFRLINTLFREYGLIVLLPDNADLKRLMSPTFEDDIFNNKPSAIVEKASEKLNAFYKVQAHPRQINLFYLKDDIRSRLTKKGNTYYVEDTEIKFTPQEIKSELQEHPERFSPNVILRGLYQEVILPNIAFVGGGGELAYWLELKDLFHHYDVCFPVLILRNSFMLVDNKVELLVQKLELALEDIFKKEDVLINELVKKESTHQLLLTLEKQNIKEVYEEIKKAVQQIDVTLEPHAAALLAKVLKGLDALENKMLKAEKKKFELQQRQIKKLKSALFPKGDLQERVENFMPWYARFGKDFIKMLYENSLTFEQQFCVLHESES